MTREEHRAVNEAAYHALKPTIEANYPPKQFVAIAGGKVVADDADFERLQEKLAGLGIGRMEALVDRVGEPPVEYREFFGISLKIPATRPTRISSNEINDVR